MPKLGSDFPWSEEQIVKLGKDYPTPFHIYDERIILKQIRGLNEAFSWCDGYRNYFAVKATPNPHIMRLLKEESCGMDCSSMTELVLSEKLGFKAHEIMFTSNNTPLAEYAKAKTLGAVINLDDLSHVQFVDKQLGLPELVSFRYNPGPKRHGNVLIGDPKEAKFGFTDEQLIQGYKMCMEKGVKRFGLHAMIVSNCLTVSELVETARMLFTLVGTIKDQLGIEIEVVDLGGGIGIPYKPEDKCIDVAAVGAGVHEAYKELILGKKLKPVKVVTECGRYITGPSGFLVTRVTHLKRIYKNYVGVDACMANLMRPGMYDAYHHITVHTDNEPPTGLPDRDAEQADNSQVVNDSEFNTEPIFDVVGGLCENNDKFAVDRKLDVQPKVGDLAVIHDAGAHGHSMGFNYNGKPRSAEFLYRSHGSVDLIRRAETIEDLFSTLDFAGLTPAAANL